jgi:hypothetical protein
MKFVEYAYLVFIISQVILVFSVLMKAIKLRGQKRSS